MSWLTPVRRKAIHSIFTAIAAIAVALNLATDSQVVPWLDVVAAGLAVISMVMAAVVAKRADWKAIYAGAAALIAAVAATGVISGDVADQATRVVEQLIVLLPLVAVTVRTDSGTPTGEPLQEFVVRSEVVQGNPIQTAVAIENAVLQDEEVETGVRRTLYRSEGC